MGKCKKCGVEVPKKQCSVRVEQEFQKKLL